MRAPPNEAPGLTISEQAVGGLVWTVADAVPGITVAVLSIEHRARFRQLECRVDPGRADGYPCWRSPPGTQRMSPSGPFATRIRMKSRSESRLR